jgi:hypothetical protein
MDPHGSFTVSVLPKFYSPECVEGKFSEGALPLYGVLGSSLGLGMRRDDGRERNIGNKSC